MSQEGERIATLETKIELLLQKTEAIETDVAAIKTSMNQQRGFVAGMLAILAPLWAVLIYAANRAWEYFYGAVN